MPSRVTWRVVGRGMLPLAALAGTGVLWEIVVDVFQIAEYLLPAPSGVLTELVKEMPYLTPHLLITGSEIVLAFVLSIVIGIPLGMLIVSSPALEAALYPLLVSSQSVPKMAVAPLLIVWAGIGILPKILVGFVIAFFPVVMATVVGLRSVEPELLSLARSMGASQMKTYFKIRFPTALPYIFAGLKVAVTLAVVGAVVGEFVQADRGLGYVMLLANGNLNMKLAFATFVLLSGLGVVMFVTVDWIERLMIPWHASRRTGTVGGTL